MKRRSYATLEVRISHYRRRSDRLSDRQRRCSILHDLVALHQNQFSAHAGLGRAGRICTPADSRPLCRCLDRPHETQTRCDRRRSVYGNCCSAVFPVLSLHFASRLERLSGAWHPCSGNRISHPCHGRRSFPFWYRGRNWCVPMAGASFFSPALSCWGPFWVESCSAHFPCGSFC